MRSYGQHCGLAKALDLVGDRWTLLMVRELLIGPCRYTDLRQGLPGIATNLLADRLQDLETAGVVYREEAPPPIAATLFHLTDRGRALEPALMELGRWGAPLLGKPARGEVFRAHWMVLPLRHVLRDNAPELAPVAIEVRAGTATLTIETIDGGARVRMGAASHPDAVLSGPARAVMGVLMGKTRLGEGGVKLEGNAASLHRVLPPHTVLE